MHIDVVAEEVASKIFVRRVFTEIVNISDGDTFAHRTTGRQSP